MGFCKNSERLCAVKQIQLYLEVCGADRAARGPSLAEGVGVLCTQWDIELTKCYLRCK
jgi:hypothetical protein